MQLLFSIRHRIGFCHTDNRKPRYYWRLAVRDRVQYLFPIFSKRLIFVLMATKFVGILRLCAWVQSSERCIYTSQVFDSLSKSLWATLWFRTHFDTVRMFFWCIFQVYLHNFSPVFHKLLTVCSRRLLAISTLFYRWVALSKAPLKDSRIHFLKLSL